ncbi:hypothetical protein [Paenibacillus herberti]|uniref:Uncharacterized protein n=1 Tax=Paenibacillus herberti TaxID=1619309 RepID=A0A229P4N4_9BACL|nr:hypothetical protein [Paenibacillus herberti]OXM17223.1 hypothetical protein CGZ75_11620 [Paenibacillus herberti]
MDRNDSSKNALISSRPHNADHCKPCKITKKPCLVTFTPLQADIFEGLLDDLAAAIQNSFVPPAGPLPSILKVLQNLIVELPLTLNAQANLLAATEMAINAYQQSQGWSSAAVASTQIVLTDLYALSLVACVASTVKDGWVIRVRLAETNLAGIESGVPPVISGTTLSFDGGNETMVLSFNPSTGLPTEGVIAGTGFVSQSIPVTTTSGVANVSIVLADNLGGNNYAFSMPRAGTLTSMTANFNTGNNLVVNGPPITVVAQLCRALPNDSPYTPFVAIPGASVQLLPSLSGNVSAIEVSGSLTGLNISLNPEDRLVLLFTIFTATTSTTADPTTIVGIGGGTLTIEPVNLPADSFGPIIPLASHLPVTLNFDATGSPIDAGVIAFGFSSNEQFTSFGLPIIVNPLINGFTSPITEEQTITSIAAYFGVESNQTLEQPINIFVQLYRYTPANSTATPIPDTVFLLSALQAGTFTTTSPGLHFIFTVLPFGSVNVNPGDRLIMVFTAQNLTATSGVSISGWASGGISLAPPFP